MVSRWQQSGRDAYIKNGATVDATVQKWQLVSKYVLNLLHHMTWPAAIVISKS